jgi:hypothetical protein
VRAFLRADLRSNAAAIQGIEEEKSEEKVAAGKGSFLIHEDGL